MAWPAESLHIKCNDNAANTVVDDTSSNNTDGTLAGGDNTSAKSVSGKINSALSLNGTDDSINFGNILNLTGNYSVSMWLKTTDVTGIIMSKLSSVGGSYWYMYCTPSGKFNVRLDGTTADADATSSASINGGTFQHLVWTYDSTTLRLYINNSADGSSSPGALGTVSNAGQLMVARWDNATSGGLFLTATWDDVRVYSGSILTTDMIAALYNSGSGTEATLASLDPSAASTKKMMLLGVG